MRVASADACPPCSDEDLEQIKTFLTKFRTRPGKRRAVAEDDNIDQDDLADEADVEPRAKYMDQLVRILPESLVSARLC